MSQPVDQRAMAQHQVKSVSDFLHETRDREKFEIKSLSEFEAFLRSLSDLQEASLSDKLCVYVYHIHPQSLQLYVGVSSCLEKRDEQHRRKRIRRCAKLVLVLLANPERPFAEEDAVVCRLRQFIGPEYVTGGSTAIRANPESSVYEERIRRNFCVSCGHFGHYIAQCKNFTPVTQTQLRSDALGASQRLYAINAHALYNFTASTLEKIAVELARFCAAVNRHSKQTEARVEEEIQELVDLAHAAKRTRITFGCSCESFPEAWLHFLSLPDGKPDSAPEHHSCAVREAAAGATVIEMRAKGRAQYNKGAELANYIVALIGRGIHPPFEDEEWDALSHFSIDAQRRQFGQPNGPRSTALLPMAT